MLMLRERPTQASRIAVLASLRAQTFIGLVLAVVLPALARYPGLSPRQFGTPSIFNSLIGAAVAVVLGTVWFRRVTSFPGTRAFGYIVPAFASSYGLVVLGMFALRSDYSRLYLGISFFAALAVSYFVALTIERYDVRRFHVVPFGHVDQLLEFSDAEWVSMTEPVVPPGATAIVADLRYELEPEWERMLAQAALEGRPVYHTKQLRESLTGRVDIEHLSENSLGSLVPNLGYVKAKRAIDVLACVVLIPMLLLPMALIALAIKLDSRGPVLFLQRRTGYRGRPFAMLKFRTMKPRHELGDELAQRTDAMTQNQDDRVTQLGRTLRRMRLDELPQIFNVIMGQMSIFGPRPEAIALSRWYEAEIPFYSYRHIVRPGISGWAQVHQGHVTDLDAVHTKLTYDFYYIKNFSAWLDVLIALRTLPTMLSGFGSK